MEIKGTNVNWFVSIFQHIAQRPAERDKARCKEKEKERERGRGMRPEALPAAI